MQLVEQPFDIFEENPQFRRAPPAVRVDKMFEEIQAKLPGAPQFLLCLFPDRKNCELYGFVPPSLLLTIYVMIRCV